jgi:adenosylcobinamide kinase/adenosylcobinamide-phosphate guanylyltransferase
MAVTLVTGPVRSGKSAYVVAMAQGSGLRVSYVATAIRDPGDDEWDTRLRRHIADRPASWKNIEAAEIHHEELLAIFAAATPQECIIVDALGTWIAARIAINLELFERDVAAFESLMDSQAAKLADAMLASRAAVLIVSEEVGWDIVPVAASARLFRDVLGRMKQRLAARAEHVYLVVCGIAVDLRARGVEPAAAAAARCPEGL